MDRRKICYKKKSQILVIGRNRTSKLIGKRSSSSSSSTNVESMMSVQSQPTSRKLNIEDTLNFSLINHMNSLLYLLKQFLCPGYRMLWDGLVTIKERNSLYLQLEFICHNGKSSTRLYPSPSMPTGRRHEINVPLAIGSTYSQWIRAQWSHEAVRRSKSTFTSSRKQVSGCARICFGFCWKSAGTLNGNNCWRGSSRI